MDIIRRLVNRWTRMLDEAFCYEAESSGIKELFGREAAQAFRDGVPSSMRSYDLIEVTSPGYSKVPDDFLIAGWQDYPQKGYLCIVNVYQKADGKWKLMVYDNFKDISSRGYSTQMFDLFKALNSRWKIWALASRDGLQGSTFNDIQWDANALLSGMSQLFSDIGFYYIASFKDRTLADASKLTTRKDVISWYQFKSTDDAPIRALLQKMAKPQPSRSSTSGSSYFKRWQQSPGCSMDEVISSICSKLDSRVQEVFGDIDAFCGKVAEFIDSYDDPDDAFDEIFDAFDLGRLVDRRAWWSLISDQTYRAVVSRSLAAYEGSLSRGVSLKTLHECIYKICYDLSMLWAQSFKQEEIFKRSKFMKALAESCRQAGLDHYDIDVVSKVFLNACGSFIDQSMSTYDTDPIEFNDEVPSRWTVCDSDTNLPYQKIISILDTLDWNEDDSMKLVAVISQIVDVMHGRGSLAGVFIEGGAKTCDQVSSMKSGEIYEAGKHSVFCRTAHLS